MCSRGWEVSKVSGVGCTSEISKSPVVWGALGQPLQRKEKKNYCPSHLPLQRRKHNTWQASFSSGGRICHSWEYYSGPYTGWHEKLPVVIRAQNRTGVQPRPRLEWRDHYCLGHTVCRCYDIVGIWGEKRWCVWFMTSPTGYVLWPPVALEPSQRRRVELLKKQSLVSCWVLVKMSWFCQAHQFHKG